MLPEEAMPPDPAPQTARSVVPTRRLALAAFGLLGLVGSAHLVRTWLGISLDADAIRAFIAESGIWAPIAFVAIVGLRIFLLVPLLGPFLLTAAGALFGLAQGTLYGALGLTLTACLAFTFVRVVGADPLRAWVPPRFQPLLDFGRSRSGVAVLTVLSGYPIGPSVWAQGGAAVSGMALLPFVLSVGIGSAVRAGTYSVFGNALVEGKGVVLAVALIAAAFAVPLLHPRARDAVRAALRPPAPAPADAVTGGPGGPDSAA